MKAIYMILVAATFALGIGIGALVSIPTGDLAVTTNTATSRALSFNTVRAATNTADDTTLSPTTKPFNVEGPIERISPGDWIKERQIEMRPDGVFISINNPQWAILANTNSMDPVFDEDSHLIQIYPQRPEDIKLGDIVTYESPLGYNIVHRVIEISTDEEGWYIILKGDNNPQPDPWKVRFDEVRRVTVMVIY